MATILTYDLWKGKYEGSERPQVIFFCNEYDKYNEDYIKYSTFLQKCHKDITVLLVDVITEPVLAHILKVDKTPCTLVRYAKTFLDRINGLKTQEIATAAQSIKKTSVILIISG